MVGRRSRGADVPALRRTRRLVDELERGGDREAGQVDGDVRQPDADEADALAGQLARGGHDHHLGLGEGGGRGTGDAGGRAPPGPAARGSLIGIPVVNEPDGAAPDGLRLATLSVPSFSTYSARPLTP